MKGTTPTESAVYRKARRRCWSLAKTDDMHIGPYLVSDSRNCVYQSGLSLATANELLDRVPLPHRDPGSL